MYSKFTLRDDQLALKKQLFDKLKTNNKIVFCASTGFGKAVCLAAIAKDFKDQNNRVLILVHRNVLIEQLSNTLTDSGVDHTFIKAGYKTESGHNVYLASCQSLNRRVKPEIDVVLLDECHLTSFSKASLHYLNQDNVIAVGFTATPWTLSKTQQLAEKYQDIVLANLPKDLIKQGVLCKDRYYANFQIDTDSVGTRHGEFKQEELLPLCNHPDVIAKVVEDWKRFSNYQPTVCFCVSVDHAKAQKQAFLDAHIPADIITGETTKEDRNQILKDLADGNIGVITSVGVLTEGWDYKGLGCVVLARPTKSKALYTQMVGRGLRSNPGKESCTIIDIAGNVKRFGLVREYDVKHYSLNYKSYSIGGDAPTKECPKCGFIQHTAHKTCQNDEIACDHVFEVKEKPLATGELKSLTTDAELYRHWLRLSYDELYKPTFAYAKYLSNYDTKPKKEWSYQAIFAQGKVTYNELNRFAKWVFNYCKDKNAEYWVFRSYFVQEFGQNVKEEIVRNYWSNLKNAN